MCAGADSIDDLDMLRAGGMPILFDGVYAPSTLGTLLREFSFGHARQLESVLREHLCALTARTEVLAGIDEQAFIDIDSLLRPVYGHAKQGASYGHTKIAGKQVPRPASWRSVATSVAGPPLTPSLRGSWTTPRRAHRRGERRSASRQRAPDQRQSPEVCFCMDGRRAAGSIAAEHDAHARHPQPRQVEAEHVWVVLVVGVQRQATVEARDRGQCSDHQVPAADEHLDTRGYRQTPAQVGDPGRQPVAAANLRPDLGVMRDVGPHHFVGNAEQITHSTVNSVCSHMNAPLTRW